MAGATPLAVTAQPHINMAGATPLAVTAQPHVNMAGATPSVVTAQPHINMADGRGYLPSGPRATNLPPWASCQQVTATTGVGVPPLPGDTRPASGNGFQSSPSDRATIGCPVSNTPFGHGSQSMMPLIRASVTPATWQAYGAKKPAVWVVGHSYIYWAKKRAEQRPGGVNLGFRNVVVNWRGIRGLQWEKIFPEVINIAKRAKGPVILVLHAGGNDLGKRRCIDLSSTMTADIERFFHLLPGMILVWSEMVPRAVWHGAKDPRGLERSRKKVNLKVARFVKSKFGIVVRHHQLEGDQSGLLRSDGIHLTNIGLDIFLSGLQDGIEQALRLKGGGRSHV
ncbi:uncharacterized protein LOC143804036 [Ranitomeya variabilis]